MIGAPMTEHEKLDVVDSAVRIVDRRGRDMDQKWGFGRLPTLVPIAVAEKFRSQQLKFSRATLDLNAEDCRKHGEAMLRAYDKLDALATEARGEPAKPDQWEFDTPAGLVVLVQDIRDATQDRLQGRQGQVWSLDEIASVLCAYPALAGVKTACPGAIVESVRPDREAVEAVGQALLETPY